MKTCRCVLPFLLLVFFAANDYTQRTQGTGVKWTGSITLVEKMTSPLGITSERYVEANFTDAVPTLWRTGLGSRTDFNFTDDKGTGTTRYVNESTLGKSSCFGTGQTELHEVHIDYDARTYRIHGVGPANCVGTTISYVPGVPTEPFREDSGTDIIVSDQPLGPFGPLQKVVNRLTGSDTTKQDTGVGTVTRTIVWNLYSGPIDAELIVTPTCGKSTVRNCTYDNWLPEPGRDEYTKGSVMNIALKVQKRGGGPTPLRAKSFELRLASTSAEPGITLNAPVAPRAKQLPDLRFLPGSLAESGSADQSMTVQCEDGSTGTAYVGSYDGGGYTILVAEAILENEVRITGHLLVGTGPQETPIPKRAPNSLIAIAWSNANGNPRDTDDIERSNGNPFLGDGLSAYEEYRGVTAKNQYIRLDPQKKELGVILKATEQIELGPGLYRFESATGIEIVVFDHRDVPENRRINRNRATAHVFDQFALRFSVGNTAEKDIYGRDMPVFGVVYPRVDIPARVTHVVIDVNRIRSFVQWASTRGYPSTEREELAQVVAHEIGHAVNVPHHGNLPHWDDMTVTESSPRNQIFDKSSPPAEILDRPYKLKGRVGSPGNQASGNMNCVMTYVNTYDWVRLIDNANNLLFYRVPWRRVGSIFCEDKNGTDLNDRGKYFGNARTGGECLKQIKLKD